MNKRTLKITALLLIIALVVPVLISCGDTASDKKAQTGGEYQDDMGDKADFEGKTFNVLAREDNMYGNYSHEVIADEGETEIVNQAVYQRNTAVEDRFGVTITVDLRPGDWNSKDPFINTFKNSIMAGEGTYDLIMSHQGYMAESELLQYFLNLFEVPYLNFNKDYWYHDIVDELTVGDKLFYAVGDYSLTYWEYLYVLYFNKKIASDYDTEDLYQLVKDGTWTIDKLIEISTGKYKDLNGDNWPGTEDQYGYITGYQNTLDALFSQFDVQATRKDESGQVVLDVDQGKVQSILEKMNNFFNTTDVYSEYLTSDVTFENNPLDRMFRQDQALFYPERIEMAQRFRDMETDFGIIPYPKWNEQQKDYPTQSQNGYSVAVVPIDVKDKAFTGAMLEALTAESNRTVIPAYNDQALTYKYTRDEASAEMLEIIRRNICINFGYFYYDDLKTGEWFRELLRNKNTNFASYYASNKTGYERKLKLILKAYEEHQ